MDFPTSDLGDTNSAGNTTHTIDIVWGGRGPKSSPSLPRRPSTFDTKDPEGTQRRRGGDREEDPTTTHPVLG